MTAEVDLLKDLLFHDEKAGLQDLAKRVDAVFERAGTNDKLQTSVARVLDGALRTAEVERHRELSEAIAPLLSRAVKAEIKNSRDDLVEALYPVTGRMVKQYVASALKDLVEQVNRRIEGNPVMLRVRSVMTGRSVAELALADTQKLDVEELYFIRRGSGELVAHWPESSNPSGGRDHLISGTLTAINEFATEAFKAEGSALRQIDLGDRQVYLRASPAYLLAAKCKGLASPSVEQVVDDEFLAAIEAHGKALDSQGSNGGQAATPKELLPGLMQRLVARVAEKQGAHRRGPRPVTILAWLIGLPLLAWIGWSLYSGFMNERVRQIAVATIAERPEMKSYPTHIDARAHGTELTLLGLAPTLAIRDGIVSNLRAKLPETRIEDQLTVVPGGPDAAWAAAHRTTDRAIRRLEQLAPDLARLDKQSKDASAKAIAGRAADAVQQVLTELQGNRTTLAGPPGDAASAKAIGEAFHGLTERLTRTGADLSALLADAAAPSSAAGTAKPAPSGDIAESADELAAEADRLAAVTTAVLQLNAMRLALPAGATPRETLSSWSRLNAIFFAKDTDYRNEQRAAHTLDEAAKLIKAAGTLVRVVGYTDERGGSVRNTPLSGNRAQKVTAALIERGVPANLLVAVGRTDQIDLSATLGEQSPNRRVEFEVGFEGEAGE